MNVFAANVVVKFYTEKHKFQSYSNIQSQASISCNRCVFCSNVKCFCSLSSEDFPSSGVLLQRSDEATEEKAVFDTYLAGRTLACKKNKNNCTLHLFFWCELN